MTSGRAWWGFGCFGPMTERRRLRPRGMRAAHPGSYSSTLINLGEFPAEGPPSLEGPRGPNSTSMPESPNYTAVSLRRTGMKVCDTEALGGTAWTRLAALESAVALLASLSVEAAVANASALATY